ncbi:hypothetical protein PVK06_047697 [Gossypium arboreum]|uniref:Uncharacterized protein n=1 Tax=Gossypium arboreum TaxID=29729 RepID=A0ABR0MDY7_GOSAR|nr:hypothetical protein PVK06_047697 [Gossypium arboreum]
MARVKRVEATNLISLKLHWNRLKLQGISPNLQWIEAKLQDAMDWKETTWMRRAPKKSILSKTGQNWPFFVSLLYSRYTIISKEGQLL